MRFGLVVAMAMMIGSGAATASPLERYAWDARLLFVFADADDREPFRAQRADIGANVEGYRDRELIAFVFDGGRLIETVPRQEIDLDAEALRRRFGLPARGFAVALIGKDTGVALRSREPVGACELFAEIDGMPMRRSEIAHNGGAVPCR